MNIRLFILVLISTSFSLFAQGQALLPRDLYSVDQQINLKLEKFSDLDSGRLKRSMKIRVASANMTFFDTYERDRPLDCYTESYLHGDTIFIVGHMLGELGWGFQLALYKDTCVAAPFALSDGKIYKYNKSDTDSTDFIILPSLTKKVVLAKRPSYNEGETVKGLVEFKSYPFYYKDLEGEFKIELQAYFKTAPLRRTE